VIAPFERGLELDGGDAVELDPAPVVCSERRAAAHDVQRCPLLRAGLGEHQSAALEFDSERRLPRERSRPLRTPLQPPGDHEVQHEPDIVRKTDRDAFTEALEIRDARILHCIDGRIDAAQQERRQYADALYAAADDSRP
jgi:hypothetical protein